MYYNGAKALADDIIISLNPYCDKIEIAGSLRRGKEIIGDLEICCIPKNEESKDMFGNVEDVYRNPFFLSIADTELGRVIKGMPVGRYMQIELPEGINLDLFMPEPHDYYRQLAIRTGSADYSFKVIATAWKKLGWAGTSQGLRKMTECIEKKLPDGKSKWECHISNPSLPPSWASEKEFFEWIRVPYIKPSERNV